MTTAVENDEPIVYGPLPPDEEGINGKCPACFEDFKEGDYCVIIPCGPGNVKESQEKMLKGEDFIQMATEVHYECHFGHKIDEKPEEKVKKIAKKKKAGSKPKDIEVTCPVCSHNYTCSDALSISQCPECQNEHSVT